MIMRLVILAALCLVSVTVQSFEVASVRPSQPPSGPRIRVSFEGGPDSSSPTRFSCRNCSLAMLVMRAYDVEYSQVAGLKTHSDDLYDVEATLPAGTTRVQFRVMLQDLLSNRFKMIVHGETTQAQGYELAVGKNGLKMKPTSQVIGEVPGAAASERSGPVALDGEGFPILPAGRPGYESVNGRARMQGTNETMDEFARKLINQLDLPVQNATGLKGRYDYGLYWTSRSTEDAGPSLFSALESQLGLKLSSKRVAVRMVVIDHVERPSEN
jgi:uncharacterized protein (TIGR03435 family)